MRVLAKQDYCQCLAKQIKKDDCGWLTASIGEGTRGDHEVNYSRLARDNVKAHRINLFIKFIRGYMI